MLVDTSLATTAMPIVAGAQPNYFLLHTRATPTEITHFQSGLPARQIAERRGWQVVCEYHDAGISGARSWEARPGLDEMLKDAQRRRFDVVMAWAIDRLGRSLIDLLATIQVLEACGVDLYLDQQSIDTTTPAGRLMFQITGAFAEFERSMIRQRVRAGLKRAVESACSRPIAEFERELIRDRTGEGRARALAAGVRFGRKPLV